MNLKRWSLIIVAFIVAAAAALAPARSRAAPLLAPELTWQTCGYCPNAPEVSVSGDSITMGVARVEGSTQPRSYHGAAAPLSPAGQYSVTFDYDLYSWDSYISANEFGKGYWDSFSVSVSSQPIWQAGISDPITPASLPGLGFIWGGAKWGDHILKHVSGTKTVVLNGNASGSNYLNVVLNTDSQPYADNLFPSWGTITIKSVTTDANLGSIRSQAAEIAKTVVGGDYLWGGKGWNFNTPKGYVSAQQVLTDGYYYYRASEEPHIVLGTGLDCSGLVYWAYNRAAGTTKFPGSPISMEGAAQQRDTNTTPVSENELQPGDLLFFAADAASAAITHVAMYVGGSDPSRNVVEAASAGAGIKYSSLNDRKADTRFRSYGRVTLAQPPLVVQSHSPVTLVVTDPDGFVVTSETYTNTGEEFIHGIPGELYYDTDENGDDFVYAPVLKPGVYNIQVVPKPGASPTDVFGLEVLGGARLIDLATGMPISEIPPQGYNVTAGEAEINPTAFRMYLPFVKNLNDTGNLPPSAPAAGDRRR